MQGENYAEFIYKQKQLDRGLNYMPCDLGNAFSGNLSCLNLPTPPVEPEIEKPVASSEDEEEEN